jgi:hypothetical protein
LKLVYRSPPEPRVPGEICLKWFKLKLEETVSYILYLYITISKIIIDIQVWQANFLFYEYIHIKKEVSLPDPNFLFLLLLTFDSFSQKTKMG